MTSKSLPQLLELPEAELRRLVDEGEPQDRLRAAWALALRLGPHASSALRDLVGGDVGEGLRQQLIVVLAGLGERSVVLEIARHEPNERVRATATAYVIRTAPAGEDEQARSFAAGKLRDESAAVRLAALGEIGARRLTIDVDAVRPLLDASDFEEKRGAVLAIMALAAADTRATEVLAAQIGASDGAAQEIVASLARSEVVDLLRVLGDGDAAAIAAVLRALLHGSLEIGWDDVSFLFARTELAVADALVRVIRTTPPESALPGLAKVWAHTPPRRDSYHFRVWSFIRDLVTEENVTSIAPEVRARLREDAERRRDHLSENVRQLEDGDYDAAYKDRLFAELAAHERLVTLFAR